MAKAEGVVFFQAGGMALRLFPRQELAKDANVAADGRGFRGISLTYNARNREELDSVLAEAQAAGATLLQPSQEAFRGGYSGTFLIRTGSYGRLHGTRFFRWQRTEAFKFPTNQ